MARLKVLLKILVSFLILYFVFQKINLEALLDIISQVNYLFLFLAVIAFILSQFISSLRLDIFWKSIGVNISRKYNWQLYLLGMYYNILLPGGIGGDGYKIYTLNKQFEIKKKDLFIALLFDRLIGLLALFSLLCLGLSALYAFPYTKHSYLLILPAILFFYFIYSKWFKYFLDSLLPSYFLSLIIQFLQLLSAYMILTSLHVSSSILNYLCVFLLSSIAAVIPITFGGAGARELTFIYCATAFSIDTNIAVSMSLIFYIISVVVSLSGVYYSFKFNN